MLTRYISIPIFLVALGAFVFLYLTGTDQNSIIVRADNFHIGTGHTHYVCFTTTVLSAGEKTYITGFTPLIDENSAASRLIHHYVLSIADPNEPDGMRTCEEWPGKPIWAWTVGAPPLTFPQGVGIELGGEKPTKLTLQVHYDNHESVSGAVDTNGIKLFVQKEQPETLGAMLTIGSIFDINVAPGEEEDFTAPRCTSEDTKKIGPITIFASSVHAHNIGRKLWMDQYRNGTKIGEINRNDYYDFAAQRYVSGSWPVLPGDELEMHCLYKNDTSRTVVGGPASDDEMCINFMMYYPRSPYEFCGGPIEFQKPGLH